MKLYINTAFAISVIVIIGYALLAVVLGELHNVTYSAGTFETFWAKMTGVVLMWVTTLLMTSKQICR